MTNDTIWRGTPNASIFSIALGRAASELVVAKAIDTGSAICLANLIMGTLAIIATGTSTSKINAIKAQYNVTSSIAKLLSTSIPMWPTVSAMAAPTPMGANSITILVNLNMTSANSSTPETNLFF